MPINPDLLIAAPMLQDAFVDKDGTPMADGIVTCFQDNSRTTLKNWYYQSGTPGNYTYIRLPNPLTLSAAGTICDINGVDTIPFFYPYSELDETVKQPYYITIVNQFATNQITRANFPFLPGSGGVTPGMGSQDNYIINNRFWRNIGTANLTNVLSMVVAPSQHDGFSNPDITFIKNITGGADTVTFTKFPLTLTPILDNDITPEFYINHTCSNTPTGETQKGYLFPISLHVNTLASVPFTATIQVQNASGTTPGQNVVNLYIVQNTGTGTTSPAPFFIGTVTANSSWTKLSFSGVMPPTAGLTLGNGGDDALYLLVQMPLDIACSINFTLPSIFFSENPPTNSFQTYDEIDAVINSPRTGDIRTSINAFYPYGWAPMNDGTIGNAASGATTRANVDTWPLYNLLWQNFNNFSAGTGSSGTNPVAQMYSGATPVGYGPSISGSGSAIADWNANKTLALTRSLGQVITGTVPIAALTAIFNAPFTASNSAGNLLLTGFSTFTGSPISFSNTGGALPTGLTANTIYYAVVTGGVAVNTTFFVATSYNNAIAGTVIAYTDSGSGTNTATGAGVGQNYGEYAHSQQTKEVGSHTHTGTVAVGLTASTLNTDSATLPFVTAGPTALSINANSPAGSAANVMQPSVWYNRFIKL